MLVFSRSGHGFKYDIRLANCVGVIDSSYKGEVMVKLVYDGARVHIPQTGDRVAQAMIIPIQPVQFEEAGELNPSGRGTDGLGSTGV
jgi:dUTP pyrophosphatase